jgi:hypothetical protein
MPGIKSDKVMAHPQTENRIGLAFRALISEGVEQLELVRA